MRYLVCLYAGMLVGAALDGYGVTGWRYVAWMLGLNVLFVVLLGLREVKP